MGIHGLETYLNKTYGSQVPEQALPRNAVLLFDGAGLAVHILGHSCLNGGNYRRYSEEIAEFISPFLRCGFRLVVFRDGPITRMKQNTHNERGQQRQECWGNLEMYCNDGNGRDMTMPFPPLFAWQFYATLARLGVYVVGCPEEADHAMAIAKQDWRANSLFVGTAPHFLSQAMESRLS